VTRAAAQSEGAIVLGFAAHSAEDDVVAHPAAVPCDA
jgi:hypothetical protein